MTGTLQGKNGVLRFYDGTLGRDLRSHQVSMGSNTVLKTNTHRAYAGQIFQFSKAMVSICGLEATNTGGLVVEYWNGSTWVDVINLADGTKVDSNTMRKCGIVSWDIPSDWKRNDASKKGSALFYVRMRTTSTPSVAPVVQLIEPCSGQFLSLTFDRIKIVAPQGRPRPQEMLTERTRWIDKPAFVQGPTVQAPVAITISCELESVIDEMTILKALGVKNPEIDTWSLSGVSTKTLSVLPDGDGGFYHTDHFADSNGKTVDVQAMWCDNNNNSGYWEWREVYFDLDHQKIFDKSIHLFGGCYGAISNNRISSFGLEIAA